MPQRAILFSSRQPRPGHRIREQVACVTEEEAGDGKDARQMGNTGNQQDGYGREQKQQGNTLQHPPAVEDSPVPRADRGFQDVREQGTGCDSNNPEYEQFTSGVVKETGNVYVYQEESDSDDEMHLPVHVWGAVAWAGINTRDRGG